MLVNKSCSVTYAINFLIISLESRNFRPNTIVNKNMTIKKRSNLNLNSAEDQINKAFWGTINALLHGQYKDKVENVLREELGAPYGPFFTEIICSNLKLLTSNARQLEIAKKGSKDWTG